MNWTCFFLNHRFMLLRKVNDDVEEVKCIRCKGEFARNKVAKLTVPLNKQLRDLHDFMLNKANDNNTRRERRLQKKFIARQKRKKR